jgi:predicted alpha/beta-hydrolase family hydrolase
VGGRVFLGGQSYGGRQASILAAEETGVAAALLLLAYPLHPPRRHSDLRTAHFPTLRTPALFVSGSRDPFGSPEELEAARHLVPAATTLLLMDGAGHDLARTPRRAVEDVAAEIATAFLTFAG